MGKHCKQEVWKTIPEYPQYQASSLARIRRLKGVYASKTRILKQHLNRGGYKALSLSLNGVCVKKRVHRIIGALFVPNPENKPHLNHKDFNRANNLPYNLEWVTPSENILYSYNAGRMPQTDNLVNARKELINRASPSGRCRLT